MSFGVHLPKLPPQTDTAQISAGEFHVRDGHPLVYASLLNHANYFLEQQTRMPGYIEERGRPVRQQWFVTHEVMATDTCICLAMCLHQKYHQQQISRAVTCRYECTLYPAVAVSGSSTTSPP